MNRTYTSTFRLVAEHRLLFKVGSPNGKKTNEDEDALNELVEAEDAKTEALKTPKGAKAKINADRASLVDKINRVGKDNKGIWKTIITGYSFQERVEKDLDQTIEKMARSIIRDRNPRGLRNRLSAILHGGNDLPPLLLADLLKTKAEIAKSLSAEIRADIDSRTEGDIDTLLDQAEAALQNSKLNNSKLKVKVSGEAKALLDSLGNIANASLEKSQKIVPKDPGFELKQQKEDKLRDALNRFGILPPGKDANMLFDNNRKGTDKKLLERIQNNKRIPEYLRPLLLSDAKSLRTGWFSSAYMNQYSALNSSLDAVNLGNRDQRMQFLLDPDKISPEAAKSGRISINVMLRGVGTTSLYIIGRTKEKYVQLQTKNAAGKKVLAVLNTETGKIFPHGIVGLDDIGPVTVLSDTNFTLAA